MALSFLCFDDLEALVGEYLLLPDPRRQVVLHLGRAHPEDLPSLGLVMADLAEWNGPREDAKVLELLGRHR